MNWYKLSNGELINLDRVNEIYVKSDFENQKEVFKVLAVFQDTNDYTDSTTFPERFASRQEAIAFIDTLYNEISV